MSYHSFVSQDFYTELMQNICGHTSETSIYMAKIGLGGEYHKYYKHTKFCKNPRGGLKC